MGRTNATNTVHVLKNTSWNSTGSLGLLFCGIILVLAASAYTSSKKRRNLPPGPPGWPFLGNALDMPRQKEWLAFTEWKRSYGHAHAHGRLGHFTDSHFFFIGNIISLSIFGRTFVVLNSSKAAIDLLHKRSSIYSDRPYFAMGGEL